MKKVFMLASTLLLVSSLAISMAAPALACNPNTDVGISASVPNPVPYSTDVTLTITEANIGDDPLTSVFVELLKDGVLIDTITSAPDDGDGSIIGTLEPSETWTWYYNVTVTANTTYTVIGHGYGSWGTDITYDTGYVFERESIDITITENGDGEGFTPGYWRNHLEDWSTTGYSPTDTFNAVFGVGPNITLGEYKVGAIWARGGGEKALIRHATAALLNAAHLGVDYPMTVAEVIAAVQDAYGPQNDWTFKTLKNQFDEYNNLEGDL